MPTPHHPPIPKLDFPPSIKYTLPLIHPSRILAVPGVHNIRDLGGLPTPHGRIKRNRVFRSAQIGGITPAGAEILRRRGVQTVFDLRSSAECEEEQEDPEMRVRDVKGIKRVAVPVFTSTGNRDGYRYGYGCKKSSTKSRCENYARGEIGFIQEYTSILTHGGSSAFRPILLHLRDIGASGGCLFHCTLGRDRTGVLAAVILSLLGVEDALIVQDYCLSDQGLAAWRPALEGILAREEPRYGRVEVQRILGVRGSCLRATLEFMRCRYGGAEGYVRSCCGLGGRDVDGIKDSLVDYGQYR